MVSELCRLMTWSSSITQRVMEMKHALWQHEDARRAQCSVLQDFNAGALDRVEWNMQEHIGDKANDLFPWDF